MKWQPYDGKKNLDFHGVERWAKGLADALPGWVKLESVGQSRHGRDMWLLTLGDQAGLPEDQPAFWIDGGTHAGEWTGVMATLYAISRWAEALERGDSEACTWFREHTIYAMPCISPDGYQALHEGEPWLRSTLRPAKEGGVRSGLDPCDLTGDGIVRQMRWRHPAGSFVKVGDLGAMRPRTIDDPPEDAYFVGPEGLFIEWDGVRWVRASLKHGLDMNRNFPSSWKPFSMFGMDGGSHPTSEPESRAVVEAFSRRPFVGASVTNHTYTGALLLPPHRPDSELSKADLHLIERLGKQAVAGTGYRTFSIHPDFTYDPDNPIVGVWDDTMTSVFGIAAYTLELWDPFAYAGQANPQPAKFWTEPDPEVVQGLYEAFAKEPGAVGSWVSHDHPQLGEVEVGGIELTRTMHNPPERLLQDECERGLKVFDRIRRSLPEIQTTVEVNQLSEATWQIQLVLENVGYLPSSSTRHGEDIGATPPMSARIELADNQTLRDGPSALELPHLDGWGTTQASAPNALYARLPDRGHRASVSWIIEGAGEVRLQWQAGRGGRGGQAVNL